MKTILVWGLTNHIAEENPLVAWAAGKNGVSMVRRFNRSTLAQQNYKLGDVISFQIYFDQILWLVEEESKDDTNKTYVSQQRE